MRCKAGRGPAGEGITREAGERVIDGRNDFGEREGDAEASWREMEGRTDVCDKMEAGSARAESRRAAQVMWSQVG